MIKLLDVVTAAVVVVVAGVLLTAFKSPVASVERGLTNPRSPLKKLPLEFEDVVGVVVVVGFCRSNDPVPSLVGSKTVPRLSRISSIKASS
jgi:hypothetical protein